MAQNSSSKKKRFKKNHSLTSVERDELDSEIESLIFKLDSHDGWKIPDGYRGSGTALIDAVYSIQMDYYKDVVPLIDKFLMSQGVDVSTEEISLSNLRTILGRIGEGLTGVERELALNNFFGSERRIQKVDAKSVVIADACNIILENLPLDTRDDFEQIQELPEDEYEAVVRYVLDRLQEVKGIGVATSRYFLILLGFNLVKPDVRVKKWFRSNMSWPKGKFSDVIDDVWLNDETLAIEIENSIKRLQKSGKTSRSIREVEHEIWQEESTGLPKKFESLVKYLFTAEEMVSPVTREVLSAVNELKGIARRFSDEEMSEIGPWWQKVRVNPEIAMKRFPPGVWKIGYVSDGRPFIKPGMYRPTPTNAKFYITDHNGKTKCPPDEYSNSKALQKLLEVSGIDLTKLNPFTFMPVDGAWPINGDYVSIQVVKTQSPTWFEWVSD